ncbi:MAG: hypothetical protein QOG64_1833, partial [Acidimicrobiaceae bacterium]|nr:hypothetical protein [Acidimicrobiaceae bacterium]
MTRRYETGPTLASKVGPTQVDKPISTGISKSEVSRICAELDRDLEAFRTRRLDGDFPYV